jgi:GT2 family glycosyltransferase
MAQPVVIAVILNTNRRDDTLALLASLRESAYPNCRAIVLDNASTDGSVPAIRAAFPDARILALEKNLGYAGNNNAGIAAALAQGAEWVLVLNEDTVLAPDCIDRLVQAGQDDPRAGMTGPMVYHHDEPAIIQSAGGRMGRDWQAFHLAQNEPDQGQFAQPREVDWLSGCAILVRRQVIEELGMLDERFFYYWEEVEWCVRAGKAGWRILHVPQAKLWHKGVQRDYRPSPAVTYYATRNRFMLLAKHRAPLAAWMVAWGQILRTLASWTLKPQWKPMRPHRDAMWRGVADFLSRRWGRMPAR